MSRLPLRNISEIEGVPLPLYRLYKEDTEEVDNKQLFLLWIVNKLKPVEFEDEFYNTMLNFKISFEDLKIYKNRKDIIEDGIIGIDFGNRYTIVVQQKNGKLAPINIGFELDSDINFENPTLMEFRDLQSFIENYSNKRDSFMRDIEISYIAYKNYKNRTPLNYRSFLTSLKRWVEGRKLKIKIKDQKENLFEIEEYKKVDENSGMDILEFYAYYLGLCINKNGIFLDYVISISNGFDNELKEKFLKSFKRGIENSIPKLSKSDNLIITLRKETTAYIASAMEHYQLIKNEKIFYIVWDIGHCSSQFEIGIFRLSNDNCKKEKRYDYVIEKFYKGIDYNFGKTILLETLAGELLELNRIKLIMNDISDYHILKLNRSILIDYLELHLFLGDNELKESIEVDFFNNQNEKIKITLVIDKNYLNLLLVDKITEGINTFFKNIENRLIDKNLISLFLSGHFSKTTIFNKILNQKIQEKNLNFKTFQFLSSTTTAEGLIKTRKGGRFLVIEKDMEMKFNFVLGRNKRGKFIPIIDEKSKLFEWIEFIDAGEEIFEIYYTEAPLDLSKNNVSVKRKRVKIDYVDEEAVVFLRIVDKNKIEYVVSKDGGKELLTQIKEIEF